MWEDLKCRSFCFCGVGVQYPPSTNMCSPTWNLSEPHNLGIFMEPLSHRHHQLLTKSPPPFPSWRMGVGLNKPSLVFLVTSPDPETIKETTWSSLIRTKDAPIACMDEELEGFRSYFKNWEQRLNIHTYVCLVMSQIQKIKREWFCERVNKINKPLTRLT